MANPQHLNILKQGANVWNRWRSSNPAIQPDLQVANLFEVNLSGVDLNGADLRLANLLRADLNGANLARANLFSATLFGADLNRANLNEANLQAANLSGATLLGANLQAANLNAAILVQTDLTEAILSNCFIYGIAAWKVELKGARQNNLIITPPNEPTITVDNLEIAQFIYLLLSNSKIRDIIDTVAKKAVLILGRFAPERKVILDALRESLHTYGYVPILFDFEKPSSRNFTETVRTLAHLSRFIIADLTDPSSIPQELQAIIPILQVPVQPVLLEGKREYAMFVDFLKGYGWVLPIHYYSDQANFLATLREHVIEPAEQKALELERR